VLRINDPEARQSIQSGAGCDAHSNRSPDVRFKTNSVTMTVHFEAGYPACIPGGLGSVSSAGSRPVRGFIDGNAALPIESGGPITARRGFKAYGAMRVFWAHALVVHTSPADGQ
jgi:hypothetical protein